MRTATALLLVALCATSALAQNRAPAVIADTRAALNAGDFAKAEGIVEADRKMNGVTPANLEADSWLGRGALAAKQYDKAIAYAEATYALAASELKKRPMDEEPRLPIAIGAAIEVMGQAGAARGQRSEAVAYLRAELKKYEDTSIHKRIQKNVNLISLEGQPALALDTTEFLGNKPPALDSLKGKVVLLFFWAHWCPDCKAMGPVIERMLTKYGAQGFTVVAPTQRYGYVAGGKRAPAAEEMPYIVQVRDQYYAWMAALPVPVSEKTHKDYGVSSTPTIVLLDRQGIVRLYNPGPMKEEAIEPLIRKLL